MATEQSEDDDHQQHDVFDDETMRMLSANLPDRIFRAPDPRIQMAAMEAERTHQMTPVLKEELRLRILAKRLERGEPDIETTHTPQTYELTEEEKLKRERRKEQNRRAAKKCREKRKMRNLDVAERFDILREENDKLTKEISYRMKQREQLVDYLKEHIMKGQCQLPASKTKIADKSECSSKSCHSQLGTSRQLTQSSLTTTPSTHVSANLTHPTSSTSKQPKLSLTIPGNYHQSPINISGSSSSSEIYRILAPPSQVSPIKQHHDLNPTIIQTLQRSHQQDLSPFQFSTTTSTTTCTIAISPTTNQLTTSSSQYGFLNQQQQQQSLYNPNYSITAVTSTNLPTAVSPKPGQPSRPAMSRTPSTTSPFAPPQSPCTGHQSSSLTLTPPPSVSSEQYFVPESPSILNTFTTTTTTSGVTNDLMIQCGTQSVDQNILTPPIIYPQFSTGNGLNYQLSPADSLSGKSPPDFDILNDKMFDDDDDDDDDDGGNNLTQILNALE